MSLVKFHHLHVLASAIAGLTQAEIGFAETPDIYACEDGAYLIETNGRAFWVETRPFSIREHFFEEA